jgi:hypothetical protein
MNQKSGLSPRCKACVLAWLAEDRKANPQKYREREAATYQRHAEKKKAAVRDWRTKNPEKVAEQTRQWQKANPDKCREADMRYATSNPEKVREKARRIRASMTDAYIAGQLQLSVKRAPPELIALKREQLAIKRMARELKKAATKPTGENE